MTRLARKAITLVVASSVAALLAACGARTELDDGGGGGAPCVEHRPAGLDGCLRVGRLGGPGQRPSDRFEAFLEQNSASVERFLAGGEPLTRAELSRFDIVIVETPTRTYSADESRILLDFVKRGGGLFVTSGYRIDEGDKPETDSLIAAFGISYVGPLLNGDAKILGKHPTTTGVTRLPFLGGYKVAAAADGPGTYEPVAFLNLNPVGGPLALGRGRAFFWGDEWIEFDDEWTGQNDTPRFWLDVMRWLAHQT